jgi:hypothetical protein
MRGSLKDIAAALITLSIAAVPGPGRARVVRFVVEQRTPFAGGTTWGEAGAYERLVGTAYMEVDPRRRLNAGIQDIDKAPRNARGMVEFSTQIFILKPVDMARSNHKIYWTANNRGNDALYTAQTVAQVGRNDIYLRMGYVIVDAGWEGDLVPVATRLVASLPIARNDDGSPIVGPMRVEYTDRNLPLAGTYTTNLEGNAAFRSYETNDTFTPHSTLTVRDLVQGPKTPIASDRWAFGSCPTGQASLVPGTFDVCYFDGFRADKLYELIYPAKNPIVMGLGYATTRDVGSFLRFELQDEVGNPNPLGPAPGHAGIRRSYITGASQTGGYLRDYIYFGFNEDERHRRVFDGIMPTIAGTDRVFLNVRFADPNIWSDQDDRHDFLQSSYPPLTYAVTRDPISGIKDGVMKRPATDPLVMQTDSGTEFWQLRGSLNVEDGEGHPVSLPRNVRLYFNSSTAHGMRLGGLGAETPGASVLCQDPTPGQAISETARALLVAMDEWADRGIEPPPSNYPRLASHQGEDADEDGDDGARDERGTLVPLAQAAVAFPAIPGVSFPTVQNQLELLDFGPDFDQHGGVLTLQPPLLGPTYQQFVPLPDQDGLDVAGVRPLQIRVPLGTSTGWNIRAPGHRPPNLCGLTGTYVPFAKTMADRLANGDPRRSLEERYGDHAGFVNAVRKAAQDLVRDRFLLQEDADAFVAAAAASDVLK